MQTIDITAKVEKIIRFALVAILVPAFLIGFAEYKYWHRDDTIELTDAKVVGTMVSVRVLANGKVKELPFEDGAEVKAGDVIARLEVSITDEEIKQLENTVQLAKDNYARLQEGQWVSVPVQRQRVITVPAAPSTSGGGGNLAKLEERANRMAELFEMGAVSAVQRDAARRAYEQARANGGGGGGGGSGESRVEYYTEYVDEFRPTPPQVLAGAEQAIKQAELSLNVAKQEARQTEVIAPVNGTIYYGVEGDQQLTAGDSVARIGDSRDMWIEAEVSEEVFDKIPLGKLVTYKIDGKELQGTVIDKLKPDVKEAKEPVELPEIPETTNKPGALIGDKNQPPAPAQPTPPADSQTPPTGQAGQPANAPPADNQTPTTATGQTSPPADNPTTPTPANSPTPPATVNGPQKGEPPKLPDGTEDQARPNDKFIIKISMPVDRDFDCKPNTTATVKIVLKKN